MGKRKMRIMSREGDTVVTWDPEVKTSTKEAETKFDELLGQGYAMFAVEAPGAKPDQVRRFDPQAFEIVAVPQLQGG